MTRGHTFLLAVAGISGAVLAESNLGAARYKLNDVTYSVPHKYELMRNFSLPWVTGLDEAPAESVWLLFPASELASGVQGYKRWFRGYSDNVEAEIVVNVLGGTEAREHPDDRNSDLVKVSEELASGHHREHDRTTGWDRVYRLVGERGTPGEGGSLFYLIPPEGLEGLPSNWRVPYCQGSPDINRQERFNCSFTILSGGLAFSFSLHEENLGIANRVPGYVRARLEQWRR